MAFFGMVAVRVTDESSLVFFFFLILLYDLLVRVFQDL